ncbi:glycosyltransferase family 4 protein [Rhodobacter sp. NSM]|uniref:glycosyltransferase family 4 protein n=1 Tax=Rhodobacter sp. NSM TaxID=3457501 RepID=UPI003FD2CA4A
MNRPDFSRLACVVSGSVPADVKRRIECGENPALDFTHLQSLSARLFTKDSAPGASRLLRRALGERFGPAEAVAEEAGNFDAILCVAEDIGVPVAIALRLRGKRVPLLVGVHGHYLVNRKFRIWARLARHDPNIHFLPLSEPIRHRLMDDFGIPSQRCRTLCVPVDCAFFTPAEQPQAGPPLILSAGAAQRDYATLAACMADVPATFRIASGSSWIADAAMVELPGNCQMGSAGSMTKLRDLYRSASMVVLPLEDVEHASGYAVAMEAMAMGKALVVTRTRAPADFFRDGETCLLVPPGDADALKAAMLRLLSDAPLRERLGRAARQIMVSCYGMDAYTSALARILAEVRRRPLPRSLAEASHAGSI